MAEPLADDVIRRDGRATAILCRDPITFQSNEFVRKGLISEVFRLHETAMDFAVKAQNEKVAIGESALAFETRNCLNLQLTSSSFC